MRSRGFLRSVLIPESWTEMTGVHACVASKIKRWPLVVSTISSAGRSEQSLRKDDLASLRKDASLLARPDLDRLAGAAGGLVVRSVGLHRVQPPVIPSQPHRLLKNFNDPTTN
jgi:hypothetical protein